MNGVLTRPLRSQHVLAGSGEAALILLNPRNGQYYTLDEVGCRMWSLCDGSHTLADMVSVIGAEFDAPPAQIEADLHELLSEMTSEHLVVEAV